MIAPHNPLMAAQHVQAMAGKTSDERMAKVLTGLSVALILMMMLREGRDLLPGAKPKEKSWQDREHERRAHQEARVGLRH